MVSFKYVVCCIGILIVVSLVVITYTYYRIACLQSQLLQLRESIIKIADACEKLYSDMKMLLEAAKGVERVAVSLNEISKLAQSREEPDQHATERDARQNKEAACISGMDT